MTRPKSDRESDRVARLEKLLAEHERRRTRALGMGGPEKLERLKAEGRLNARERIDRLVDQGSFLESGLFAVSNRPGMSDRTPADGKIAGFGSVNGRPIALVANDFTVMGASSAAINGKKVRHVKEVATSRGLPMVFLGESSGARMPDVMGAAGLPSGDNPTQYRRTRETPWTSALLGDCYGSSAWYAAMSDFVVMRKGVVLAVSSSRLTSLAVSEDIDPQELGGWKLHCESTGLVDLAVDTDEEAIDLVKRFLSFLPGNNTEPPPRVPAPPGSDERREEIPSILPVERTQGYDMRRLLSAIADRDSVFELKARFGRSVVTALARLDGRTIGIVANNPMFKGGALDADACDKVTSFIVLCDSFNIALVFFVDQPGFLIGLDGERKRAPGKIMNWMNALSLCTVPKVSVIVRKSYGQAILNMGGAGNADEVVCWPTAEVSFMDPGFAVQIVHGVTRQDDPERYDQLVSEMAKDTSAYSMAAVYAAHAVIQPQDTRDYLKRILAVHELRLSGGVGDHLLRTWPTSY